MLQRTRLSGTKPPATAIFLLVLYGATVSLRPVAAEDGHESNRKAVLLAVELMNEGRFDELGRVIAQDYRRHSQATPDANVESLDDFVALLKEWGGAFSDVENRIDRIIVEGDFVAMWGTYSGTHTGQMGPFPATQERMSSDFAGYHRMESGKIAETWVTWDNMAIFGQLGISPCPPVPSQPAADTP